MQTKFGTLKLDVSRRTFDASADFTRWKNYTPAQGADPGPGKFADLFGSVGSVLLAGVNRLEIPTLMVQVGSNPAYLQLPPRKSFFIASAIASSEDPTELATTTCASGLSLPSIVVGMLLGISETLPANIQEPNKVILDISKTPYLLVDDSVRNALVAAVTALLETESPSAVLLAAVAQGSNPGPKVLKLADKRVLRLLTSLINAEYKPGVSYYKAYQQPTIGLDDQGHQIRPLLHQEHEVNVRLQL
jgi:hypothetical protein